MLFVSIALVIGIFTGIEVERRCKVSETWPYQRLMYWLGELMQKIGLRLQQQNPQGQPQIGENGNDPNRSRISF